MPTQNDELIELIRKWTERLLNKPDRIFGLTPCHVKVLMVADGGSVGGLDFSLDNFGLRTFVQALMTMPGNHVRFDLTLAHIDNVSDDAVMLGQPGISRSIKQFKFDDANHFTPNMYDQVWLFGVATFYSRGPGYPSDRLADNELRALSEFMNGGGGLFATGDHGSLGVCLSGSVPRARSMRRWGPPGDDPASEVSMTYDRRNDTNRIGSSGVSQFDDQSDHIPQDIRPKMYKLWSKWRTSHPHPLLCGPRGMIRVLPDHPHEGECVIPADMTRTDTFSGFKITEYPRTLRVPRPIPEVIATSSVLSDITSGFKEGTQAHTFGAICAYDGHRAGVGRVVTDATWHHFVNVNLVGDRGYGPPDPATPKSMGFLIDAAGQGHLENIRTYYRNIAVWIASPASLRCMRKRIVWGLLWRDRVMEAVLTNPKLTLADASLSLLHDIGNHARDVLGLYAGQCTFRVIILDLVGPFISRPLLAKFDPWAPLPEKSLGELNLSETPWMDLDPVLDVAMGGALVALREAFPMPDMDERISDEALDEAMSPGIRRGVELSLKSFMETAKGFNALFISDDRGAQADAD